MGKFMVFCLSTVGAATTLALVAGAGAAGLYYWHGEGGCGSLPRRVQVLTETPVGTRVYELGPQTAAASADAVCPMPVPLAAAAPTPGTPHGPTDAEIAELKARLTSALQRLAALEAQRRSPAAPAVESPADDF